MPLDDERVREDALELLQLRRELVELKGDDYVTSMEDRLRSANRGDEVPQAIQRHLAHAKLDAAEERAVSPYLGI